MAPLVTALLTGPLAWLGLVDVVSRANHLVAFRPRPSARVLARGTLPADAFAAAPLAVAATSPCACRPAPISPSTAC